MDNTKIPYKKYEKFIDPNQSIKLIFLIYDQSIK